MPRREQRTVEAAVRDGETLEDPALARTVVRYARHRRQQLRRDRWLLVVPLLIGVLSALELLPGGSTPAGLNDWVTSVAVFAGALAMGVYLRREGRRLDTAILANQDPPA